MKRIIMIIHNFILFLETQSELVRKDEQLKREEKVEQEGERILKEERREQEYRTEEKQRIYHQIQRRKRERTSLRTVGKTELER